MNQEISVKGLSQDSHLGKIAEQWAWCAILTMTVIISVALRLIHIDWGLPLRLNHDEVQVVEAALRIARGDPNPHWFLYPSGFLYTLSFLFTIARTTQASPESPYLLARLAACSFGVGTVFLLIPWTRHLWNRWAAILSAGLMAILYTPVEMSHIAKVDMALIFWCTLTWLLLTLALKYRQGSRKYIALAAVSAGIAIGMKYTGIILMIPLILASIYTVNPKKQEIKSVPAAYRLILLTGSALFLSAGLVLILLEKQLLEFALNLTQDGIIEKEYLNLYRSFIAGLFAMCLLSLTAYISLRFKKTHALWHKMLNIQNLLVLCLVATFFIISSPYIVGDWRTSVHHIFFQLRVLKEGGAATNAGNSLLYDYLKNANPRHFFASAPDYLRYFLGEFGVPAIFFILWGLTEIWKVKRVLFFMVLFYLLCGVFMICQSPYFATRYLLPLYPVLCVIAAGGARAFILVSARLGVPKFLASIVTAILLLAVPLRHTYAGLSYFMLTDTRELAFKWAEKNVPPDSSIVYDFWAPDFSLSSKLHHVYPTNTIAVLDAITPRQLLENKINYVFTGFPQRDTPPEVISEKAHKRLAEFEKYYKLIQSFQPTSGVFRGHHIWLYQLIRSKNAGSS